MKTGKIKSGMTLPEVLTTIMIVALLAALSLPAVKAIFNSFSSTGSAEAMINAALSNARAIAMKEQRYAGVRFQKAYNPSGTLDAAQYMIFIINDTEATKLAWGFRAMEGMQPIKLPDNTAVMDLYLIITHNETNPVNPVQQQILADNQIVDDKTITDASTFSIIFSPQGNMVVHGVRVRNKNGRTDDSSRDDIFNTKQNVEVNGYGLFYQDDYFEGQTIDLCLGPEPSRRMFIIYEQDKFKRVFEQVPSAAYTGYLKPLLDADGPTYINSYTGTIISTGTGQ